MAKKLDTINLLILDPSSDDAEQTINILRNGGHAVRATQIKTEQELETALEKQFWDLFIVRDGLQDLTAEKCLEIVNHYGSTIHFIMTTNQYSAERKLEILRLGMKDLAPEDNDEFFKLVVERELCGVEDRRSRIEADRALKETDKRNELLLDSSREAIAYIIDGMHIHANGAYMEMFGFDNLDDLSCVPVMDLMQNEFHASFKQFMKDYSKGDNAPEFEFTAVNDKQEPFEATLSLTDSEYDGEKCTQAFIKTADVTDEELERKLISLKAEDRLTGLYNEEYFVLKVDESISSAAAENQLAAVFYIDLNGFDKIQEEHGITKANLYLKEVSSWLIEQLPTESTVARIGDSTFTALLDVEKPSDAKNQAKVLCVLFSEHLFEAEGITLKDTLSIGICPIQESSSSSEEILSNAHFAATNVQSKGGNGYRMHDQSLDALDNRDEAQTAMEIQDALDAEQIKVIYEPIVKLQGESKQIFHASLTYKNKGEDNQSITDVFDIGMKSSTAQKLDLWLIEQSFIAFGKYAQSKEDVILKITLTSASLFNDGLISELADLMAENDLSLSSIILEFNEDDVVTHLKKAIDTMKQFADHGIETGLANFGKTLDSESVVNAINGKSFKWLTLDTEFFNDFSSNAEAQGKVEQLVSFANTNQLITIAPEISDPGTLALLWPMQVGHIQGEYVAPSSYLLDFDFSEFSMF